MKRNEQIQQEAINYARRQDDDLVFGESEAFIAGAMWADKHPNWVSVEDVLPPKESEYEDNSIVVLATNGNNVYKALYRSSEYLSGWFTHDLWALDNITHWMPLPAPPRKENE